MTRYELWHWHMIMILMICEWISQDQNIQETHRKQPFQFVGTPPERSQWPRAVPSHGSFVAWSDIWTSALAWHGGSWSSWESARGFCPVLSIFWGVFQNGIKMREREILPLCPNKILQYITITSVIHYSLRRIALGLWHPLDSDKGIWVFEATCARLLHWCTL